jgi:regulator of cell morphogenesis and NO signaling
MEIQPESRVGEIAAHHPLATRILARHGIDFCCGGGVPLKQACEARGLSADSIVAEMRAELAGAPATRDRWLDAPLADLVAHIVETYHRPLREELPRLEAMARKVARVHADRDPEGRLPAVVDTFVGLRSELEEHMAREESALFPALLAATGDCPVEPFVDDHTAAGDALARLRELTEGYVAPPDACNTWRALWAGLAALESTMHEHVHLENNVLFPRATGA